MAKIDLQTVTYASSAVALLRQGNSHVAAGHFAAALPCYEEALRLEPAMGEAWISLGGALAALGRWREGEEACHRGLRLSPAHAVGLNNLGVVLSGLGRYAAAAGCFEAALGRKPDFVQAHVHLANALFHQAEFEKAIDRFEQALVHDPASHDALLGLTGVLARVGQITRAIETAARAASLHPDSASACAWQASLLITSARFAAAEAPLARVEALQQRDPRAASHRLLGLNHMPDWSAERVFEAHRDWGRAYAAARKPRSEAAGYADRDRTPARKLRIGYVSPDFRFHPVGRFFLPLIARHDQSAFEVTCYAESVHADEVTRQIASYSGAWRTTVGLNDDEMCARVLEDRIDILVDLAGHTAHNRLDVFARKPAPLQVSWLGYLNTTGLPAVDYRFSDAVLDPPGRADALSIERLLRLPTGFVCFAAPAQAPAVALRPADAAVTFGIANRASKLNLPMARLWAQIVARVPGSRLAVQTGEFKDAELRAHVAGMLREAGLPEARCELLDDPQNYTAYLERFGQFDVMLDPSPYSGVTTTCEALWQGVPVVSLAGDRHAARGGASVLSHAGLAELVTHTHEGYVEAAVALARDRPRLAALRAGLRERVRASPLCDQRGFAGAVEQAFAAIWHEHVASNGTARNGGPAST